jgi:hypothetical protein
MVSLGLTIISFRSPLGCNSVSPTLSGGVILNAKSIVAMLGSSISDFWSISQIVKNFGLFLNFVSFTKIRALRLSWHRFSIIGFSLLQVDHLRLIGISMEIIVAL